MHYSRLTLKTLILLVIAFPLAIDADELEEQAESVLREAVAFFREKVSIEGGYLWQYSADLERREGEGRASATTAWVQPPGTPTVGDVLLRAHQLTGDAFYLEAARETAHALVRGQLRSGGWDYRIEFAPADRRRHAYNVDPSGLEKRRNTTTLDDNTTQEALRFLMRMDRSLGFEDASIHGAVTFALKSLLRAQYPNGSWPQRFESFPDPADHPIEKASFPESWSREWTRPKYRSFYTFNDNAISDVIDVLFEASRIYEKETYRQAAERGGDFILLAQLPDPQPGWAQQYDENMRPAWARKFEPPAVTGGESSGVIRTLLRIYRETRDPRFVEPIPRALAYYRRSILPEGGLARFYELKTNRPLYFTKDYRLTYDDGDMPTHYSFKVPNWVNLVEREYEATLRDVKAGSKSGQKDEETARRTPALEKQVRSIVEDLDERGAWVEDGRLRYHGSDDPTRRIISCRTFVRNVETLARFLASKER